MDVPFTGVNAIIGCMVAADSIDQAVIHRWSMAVFAIAVLINAATFAWVSWHLTHLAQPAIELFRHLA